MELQGERRAIQYPQELGKPELSAAGARAAACARLAAAREAEKLAFQRRFAATTRLAAARKHLRLAACSVPGTAVANAAAGGSRPPWNWSVFCGAVSVVMGVIVTFQHSIPGVGLPRQFLAYDDPVNFERNVHTHSCTPDTLRWVWRDGVVLGVWEPVSLIFKAVLGCVAGRSAAVYLFASLLLHMFVTLSAFLLCYWGAAPQSTPAAAAATVGGLLCRGEPLVRRAPAQSRSGGLGICAAIPVGGASSTGCYGSALPQQQQHSHVLPGFRSVTACVIVTGTLHGSGR
jgi:hypothetical protein